jgi:hypothetical protein
MTVRPDHLQPDHLDPQTLFHRGDAVLWYIETTHPDIVGDCVSVTLATAVVFSIDKDRSYALLVLHEKYSWSDEAIPELLRYITTQLSEPEGDVKDTFSVEVFRGEPVGSPADRQVWWHEDYIDDPSD